MIGWDVSVEVVLLRVLADGSLAFREVRAPADPHRSPDDIAVDIAACERGVCHSTSWRSDGPGRLVLTYAVLPDPAPDQPAEPLIVPEVVAGDDPLKPAPGALDATHVAGHAVRHLADLAHRDPVVSFAAQREPGLWGAVLRTAGRTVTEETSGSAEG